MKELIFFLLLSLSLNASEHCHERIYSDICEKALLRDIDLSYIESFLDSNKTKVFDNVSFELMQPKFIEQHKQNEKRANNSLLKFIPEIVSNLREYKEVYDIAEDRYGVNREIVASILMKETRLGKITPKHDAFVVFHTLLSRTTPNSAREKWLINMSKSNIVAIIEYCYQNSIEPNRCNLQSSYAGAIGISQFMPNNLKLAVSLNDTTPDITSMEDAILSTSNFLSQKADFNELIEWEKMSDIEDIENRWYDFEFENQNASFVYDTNKNGVKVYNCFTCDIKELEYIKKYAQKIMSYNNSSNYAIGVLRLAYEAYRSR